MGVPKSAHRASANSADCSQWQVRNHDCEPRRLQTQTHGRGHVVELLTCHAAQLVSSVSAAARAPVTRVPPAHISGVGRDRARSGQGHQRSCSDCAARD